MDGKNKYTKEDIKKLKKIWTDKKISVMFPADGYLTRDDRGHWKMGSEITLDNNPDEFLRRMVLDATENLSMRGTDTGEEKYDVYAFVFYVPIEYVPMHLNDKILNDWGLVKWRLMIGK